MYKPKHKYIKTTSFSISAGLNVVLVVICYVFISSIKANISFDCYDCGVPFVIKNNQPPLVINIKKDKVTLEIPGEVIRKVTLDEIEKLYNISFSDEEKVAFKQTGIVGVPLSDFKTRIFDHYLDNKGSEIPGIPCRADNTELFDWIMKARIADAAINQRALTITIKADSSSSNNTLKQVEATLLKQQVQWFNLITGTSNKLLHFNDDGKLLSAEDNSAKNKLIQ